MLKIRIISGAKNTGKTTFVIGLLGELNMPSCAAGFYTKKHYENGSFIGYNLIEIGSDFEYSFIRLDGNPDYNRLGKFYFIPFGIERGSQILQKNLDAKILIIDEAGPLELSGKGFADSLRMVVENYQGELLITIRDYLVEQFRDEFFRDADSIKIYTLSDREALLEDLTRD